MWHLYYKPNGDISVLSKRQTDCGLPYLRIADDLAAKFHSLEHRYIDWQVTKHLGRFRLTPRQNITKAVWYTGFVPVLQSDTADIVLTRKADRLSWQGHCVKPLTVWVTAWNNPLYLYGTLRIPTDSELLLPNIDKISIFTNYKTDICYHDQTLSS